jgi:hypothetical protein
LKSSADLRQSALFLSLSEHLPQNRLWNGCHSSIEQGWMNWSSLLRKWVV